MFCFKTVTGMSNQGTYSNAWQTVTVCCNYRKGITILQKISPQSLLICIISLSRLRNIGCRITLAAKPTKIKLGIQIIEVMQGTAGNAFD